MTIIREAVFSAETRIITDMTYFAGAPAISATQAKSGTYAYSRGITSGVMGKALNTTRTAVRVGFWLYLTSATMANTTLLYFAGHGLGYNNGHNFISIEIRTATSELLVLRHNTASGGPSEQLASATLPTPFSTTGTWFHVGITHKVDAVDGFLSVYVNGTRVMQYLGDTRPSHWSGSQQFQTTVRNVLVAGAITTSGSPGFTNAHVDDIFVDSIEDEADGPVPSRRFLPSLPTGVGADAEWTPVPVVANWQNVDDNPNNGDTDYNKALAVDLRDTFVYSDISLPVDHRIVAVLPSPFAKRLDSEIDHKLSVHAWDGVQYLDSADLDLSMSYDVPVFDRFTLQPDGSLWNETDFNAMQWGYRSRGTF